jgi:two-component system, OmpR family, phosphate regulon response regulator PhoB
MADPGRSAVRSALIVSGTFRTRWMYAKYLAWRGLQVRDVSTASAALDYLTAFTPDVVVIEGTLGDAAATDLARSIRSLPALKDMPLVRLENDAFGLVAPDDWDWDVRLTVPCLPDHLLEAMQRAAERRRAITERT